MFLQIVSSGIAIGCIYALIALGFVLIYKASEVVNFAQGDLMMIGAFLVYSAVTHFHVPFIPAFLIAVIIMAVLGKGIDRLLLRPLVGEQAFALIMATIGLGILIRSIGGMIWGYDTFSFQAGITDRPVRMGSVALSSVHIWIIAVTLLLIVGLYYFFNRTKTGVSMEAASQNQLAAYLMGIGVKKVFSNIWAISAMVATVAGVLLTPLQFLNYNMGFVGLKAFPAAVLGGFGSIPGAIVGGIIIGVSESIAGVYLPEGFKEIFAWIILIGVLMIRPEGIFGIQERKRV
ncbi:amino acid/amide ABC transporter membrane protein 1, HAAT family (TC 3.A.1.4.-) [Desulfatibacillum alkenivorans DSM 16219]|jgi:branched-chain amino acid transport system permease protein|uniref:Amino acid/amide ABC transporter membrane protein 1, HAAT family (TC 3.A.1.4.-) n=1 Tax=Desulfatibacillum alkenivorans DSM 16219 TaxID=1121393 RepID=A0A1M6I3Y1_9BACT|nr:branched-chain amino acid ABC transporter permease [Desulfatibacillum alkenivorans]SHJ29166.1 amino acid/amide ABC transporter membrane protein 1, HAAT family (TC 3.A.1.4.-) [Desulfatibacillum alkenivorans DSM 16219]